MNHRAISVDSHTHLSPQDLAALRNNLHEQQRFRQDQLRQLAAAAAASCPGRPSQQHTPAHTQIHDTLTACAHMVLTDVEAALDRIIQGSYGHCHLCHRTIDRERLMIVPQARYCTRCQHTPETGR
ncbi:TraR/DksA family transcriptional regulator [Streptomyces sp. NPDC002795]|uniref:TraR/DksA family transcriptional regulator n=1 Tax=Streptomyces sp. NPDC002795 TaxID=3364665 RepID=UPI0036BCA75D